MAKRGWESSPPATILAGTLLGLLLAGCAHTAAPLPAPAPGPIVLQPRANPALAVTTSGTLGPRPARSAADRGFGEYDTPLQSSLYLCSVAGPAAGPCLAVLGGLVAVAGATRSLVYGAMQGDSGRAATALTGEQFAALPALRELPAAIATHAAARFPRAGMDAVTVSADGCARAEVLSAQAVHILAMDTLELEFAPGYRIRLIAVATATRAACAGGSAPRVRRLAHLGKIWVLPRQPAAAGAALNTALAAVAADLGAQVALYLQAQDPGVP